jgi:general secretion pathway protein H
MSATGRPAGAVHGERGFTLLETLVVLGITVLIGALVFPDVERSLQSLALRQTAAVVQANLRVARGEALRGDQMIAFSVDADGGGYGWTTGPAQRAPRGVELTLSNRRPITFFPDGSSSGGEVALTGAGRQVTVSVDPQTGAVAATS